MILEWQAEMAIVRPCNFPDKKFDSISLIKICCIMQLLSHLCDLIRTSSFFMTNALLLFYFNWLIVKGYDHSLQLVENWSCSLKKYIALSLSIGIFI